MLCYSGGKTMARNKSSRWRRWARFYLNSFICAIVGQATTVALFTVYQLMRRPVDSSLAEFPTWLGSWALGMVVFAVILNTYFFRKGLYDHENPVLRDPDRAKKLQRHRRYRSTPSA